MSETNVSDSVYEVYVPSVVNLRTSFKYNFYEKNERTSPYVSSNDVPYSQKPRYVIVNWDLESDKAYNQTTINSLAANSDKIFSEDQFPVSGYFAKTFSDVAFMIQGSNDLEDYSSLVNSTGNSLYQMSQQVLSDLLSPVGNLSDDQKKQVDDIRKAQEALFSMPYNNLGLSVFDKDGKPLSDKNDLDVLYDFSNNLNFSTKISSAIVNDIFRVNPTSNTPDQVNLINRLYSQSRQKGTVFVNPYEGEEKTDLIGYKIERFLVKGNTYNLESTKYIGNPGITTYLDEDVLYGVTYYYVVRAIGLVAVFDDTGTENKLLVSSRPATKYVECFEHRPPPYPQNINFEFNYKKNSLNISWENPANSQRDIKQYQLFRRKSMSDPFELIAQYSFDDSAVGPDGKKYTTGERVDGNDPEMTRKNGYQDLIKIRPGGSINYHEDKDFMIDTEFFQEEPVFIYSVSSIDAHGMISNYSPQFMVTFDPYKNRIVVNEVATGGAPRQYPNLTSSSSFFKEAIRVEDKRTGQTRKMSLFFNPDCAKIKDKDGKIDDIVVTSSPTDSPRSFYMLQLINLDNQKVQQLRIDVET